MKLPKTNLYYLLIILCILFQNRFFHILNASRNLTMGLIFSTIILFLYSLMDKRVNAGKWIYRYIVLVFIVVIVPQGIYAFSQGETIEGYIDVIRGLLNILLSVPIIKYFYRKKGMKQLLDSIAVITAITLSLIIINSFFLNNFGLQLLPFDYYQMPTTGRWGRLRLFLICDFIGFISIYSFSKFLEKNKKSIFYLISFAICLIAEIYVEQARMLYMAIIATCIFIYAHTLKEKKYIINIIAIAAFLVGLISDWFDPIFSAFSVNNSVVGISTLIRINEIKYAFVLIGEHPLLGTGMTSQYLFQVMLDGFSFEFNHTDIGLLGSITYIGAIGVMVLVIMPYIRILNTIRLCSKTIKNSSDYNFIYGIFVYITITAFTVLITDNARIFVWPFILAVNEYIRGKCISHEYIKGNRN